MSWLTHACILLMYIFSKHYSFLLHLQVCLGVTPKNENKNEQMTEILNSAVCACANYTHRLCTCMHTQSMSVCMYMYLTLVTVTVRLLVELSSSLFKVGSSTTKGVQTLQYTWCSRINNENSIDPTLAWTAILPTLEQTGTWWSRIATIERATLTY